MTRLGSSAARWIAWLVPAQGGFDRASMIRHGALCLAALAAFVLRFEIHAGMEVLWIIGIAATLNLLSFQLARYPRARPAARLLSPAFGIGGWAALVHFTGGLGSPFTIGFAFEILLAALSFSVLGTVLATAGSVGALWLQATPLAPLGLPHASAALEIQTGILAGIGGAVLLLTLAWGRERSRLARNGEALAERLRDAEIRLDRAGVTEAGSDALASFAHGLKNSLSNLHGFADLLAESLEAASGGGSALEGLKGSIEQLDRRVRNLIESGRDVESIATAAKLWEVIDQTVREASQLHPRIRWSQGAELALADVRISPVAFREILIELLNNAADALDGPGEVRLTAHRAGPDVLEIEVRDNGPGVPREDVERVFDPGRTTKRDGTGLGLFFARRVAESCGGRLVASLDTRSGPGACFRLALPTCDSLPGDP